MNWQQFRPSPLGALPPVTKYMLIINIILFAAKFIFFGKIDLDRYLDLYYFKSDNFKPFQLITHMFMHGGFIHIVFNMFGLYSFGTILEQIWGSKKFLNFYLVCGLGAALAEQGSFYYQDLQLQEMGLIGPNFLYSIPMLGASGAILGLLGGFAVLFPNVRLQIFMLPPMAAKYVALLYGAASIVFGAGSATGALSGGGIAHFAHLGGLVIGVLITLFWRSKGKNFF